MAQPFVGQMLLVPYNFAPVGWALCQGQLLPIDQYDVLFALIGTTYGGDGQTTFALPDLQGRVPLHAGNGYVLGQKGGVEQVTLTLNQLPAHNHFAIGSSNQQTAQSPNSNVLAKGTQMYVTPQVSSPNTAMSAQSLTPAGGSQPHDNLQPYLTMNWIIALFGIFPTQS
jgi:microcystin-dependent protein